MVQVNRTARELSPSVSYWSPNCSRALGFQLGVMAAGGGALFDLDLVFQESTEGAGDILTRPNLVFVSPPSVSFAESLESPEGHPEEYVEGDTAPRDAGASTFFEVIRDPIEQGWNHQGMIIGLDGLRNSSRALRTSSMAALAMFIFSVRSSYGVSVW